MRKILSIFVAFLGVALFTIFQVNANGIPSLPMSIYGSVNNNYTAIPNATISFGYDSMTQTGTVVDWKFWADNAFADNLLFNSFSGEMSVTVITNWYAYTLSGSNITSNSTWCLSPIVFESLICDYTFDIAWVLWVSICTNTQHYDWTSCVSNTQTETISNWTRTRTWNDTTKTWWAWVVTCNSWYNVSGGACVATTVVVNWACWTATTIKHSTYPTTNLCSAWNASGMMMSGSKYMWKCNWLNWWTTASCEASSNDWASSSSGWWGGGWGWGGWGWGGWWWMVSWTWTTSTSNTWTSSGGAWTSWSNDTSGWWWLAYDADSFYSTNKIVDKLFFGSSVDMKLAEMKKETYAMIMAAVKTKTVKSIIPNIKKILAERYAYIHSIWWTVKLKTVWKHQVEIVTFDSNIAAFNKFQKIIDNIVNQKFAVMTKDTRVYDLAYARNNFIFTVHKAITSSASERKQLIPEIKYRLQLLKDELKR